MDKFNNFLKEKYLESRQESKFKRIKNPEYRRFLDEGIIKTISEDDINLIIGNIKGNNKLEARSLVICLYYTGARPNEVLRLKAKDIKRDKRYIIVKTLGSKNGLPRSIYLLYKKPMVKEFYKFASSLFPERYLFWNFKGNYRREFINRKGLIKERIEITQKLRYHFDKWSSILPQGSIPPYFLRHNRFSKLAQAGATIDEMRVLKGAKTYNSVLPYVHMSTIVAKKVARKMD